MDLFPAIERKRERESAVVRDPLPSERHMTVHMLTAHAIAYSGPVLLVRKPVSKTDRHRYQSDKRAVPYGELGEK